MTELHGVIAALCTPFDQSGERVDEAALRNHLDAMLKAGVHGIVLCAGTGEFAYLRDGEVVESGSHRDLLVLDGGAYRRFVELQRGEAA